MKKESFQLLTDLVQAPSPSGFEEPVQKVVRKEMEKFADEVKTDVHGNVMGIKNPQGKPRLMLAGHCDEIGFTVKYIDEKGFISFSSLGGVDAHITPGKRVQIHTRKGPVLGVIGRKAIHMLKEEERKKVVELSQQWIDIGVKDKKEAETMVSIGDPITFWERLERLGGELVVSRGFDDKVGIFVICEVLRRISNRPLRAGLFAVSTVQEEIGLRGARTAAYAINPQVGIAIDVDLATDHPDVDKKREGEILLGKGVVLFREPSVNPKLGKMLIEIAQKKGIPYQLAAISRGSTDANVIQLSRAGVATAVVSVPVRYTHTPAEVLSLKDLEAAVTLLSAFVLEIKEGMSFIP